MSLVVLPNEILFSIAGLLEYCWHINSFVQVNRHLHDALNPYLYHHNIKCFDSSALRWAAKHGKEVTARYFLDAWPGSLAGVTEYGLKKALASAAMKGSSTVMKQLLERGVDPNMIVIEVDEILEKRKESMLLLAVRHGHESTVSVLLDYGADKNSAAVWAAEHGNLSIVKMVMEVHHCRADALGPHGMTPLMQAAKHGHVEIIKYLLQIGADPNYREFGNPPTALTPLCWAAKARENATQAVQCLLDVGADVNPIMPDGVTMYPLCAGLKYRSAETASLLLEHMDIKELPTYANYQKVLLSAAAACGSETLVQRLLEAGCSPNAKAADGGVYFGHGRTIHETTALSWAIYFDHEEIASLLLEYGAEASRHPLCEALERKNQRIVDMLIEKGAEMDYDLLDSPGFAADFIEEESIKFMMERSDEPKIGDIMMREAIMADSGRASLVKMLLDEGVKPTVPSDEDDASELLTSAARSGAEMLELLFQNGFEVPQRGSFCSHKTLVAALAWNEINTVVYLMKKGFSLSQDIPERRPWEYWSDMYPSSLARTVQSLATLEGGEEILDTLIGQGLRLERKRGAYTDWTCLGEVVKKKHTPGLTLLLKKGADPLFRSYKGETPLSKATSQGWSEGIMVLLDYIPKLCTGLCRDEVRQEISRAEAKSASDRKWKNVKRFQDFYQRHLNSSVKCECGECSYEMNTPRPEEIQPGESNH